MRVHYSPVITDLDRPEPVSDTRRSWLLPVAAALCLLAFIGVAGAANDRRGSEAGARAAAPAVTPSVAADAWQATRDLAPLQPIVAVPPSWQIPEIQLERSATSTNLGLPAGSYKTVTRVASAATTGLYPADEEALVQLRYRLADDRVAVLVRLPRSDQLRGIEPVSYTASSVVARGIDARVLTGRTAVEPTILLWSEGIRAYQLYSSVHSIAELVQLAEQLR